MNLSLHIGLCLCLHVVVVLEELSPLDQLGIVIAQRVGRDPGLDRGTSPTVDDDTLGNFGLLIHPLAKEIADGREVPGILLVDRLPVDGCRTDVILHTVNGRLVLNAEQTDIRILIGVDLLCVLRIDTLDRDVDVRLAREQPHVTY